MRLDFLKDFDKRMKKIGAYALISYNSFNKAVLKNYGFEPVQEGTNLIYAVMLYIMEQSLKEEICTIDDIAAFVEDTDRLYFHKQLDISQCRSIADFVVNTVLCNNGEAMYFKGFHFESASYKDINISLVNNETVEIDAVRRTSYYLTEDGYYLLLGTLEVESNMKLTIQEMIFKLHLEKADYDQAIEAVKQLFNMSRIQLQKIEDSIRQIRENVLSFLPEEYDSILSVNMNIIEKQKNSFNGYRDYVSERERDLIENNIDIHNLNQEDEKALVNLGIIKKQLSRVIDEHQRILNSHFDFKRVYSDALLDMTAFSAIKRISFTQDLYEPILQNMDNLESLPKIFRSIYKKDLPKYYNIKKCIQPQRVIKARDEEDEVAITFDEHSLKEERERRLKIKLDKYKGVLEALLIYVIGSEEGRITLEDILHKLDENKEMRSSLIPSAEIFREVMIELLKSNRISIVELQREAQRDVDYKSMIGFELNVMLLQIIDKNPGFKNIKIIETVRDFSNKELKIYDVITGDGYIKTVTCSNLVFKITI